MGAGIAREMPPAAGDQAGEAPAGDQPASFLVSIASASCRQVAPSLVGSSSFNAITRLLNIRP